MKIYKILLHITYASFILVLITSCNTSGKKTENNEQPTKKMGKIILPDSLFVYNPFNGNSLDNNEKGNSALKIYTYLDVSCPSCLSNIKRWRNFELELKNFKIPIIMICQSEDKYELLKYLCEKQEIPNLPFPFYFDTKNQFLIRNQFLNPSPGKHTVLTDKNNLVIQMGDPTLSKKTKNAYLKIIKASISY